MRFHCGIFVCCKALVIFFKFMLQCSFVFLFTYYKYFETTARLLS